MSEQTTPASEQPPRNSDVILAALIDELDKLSEAIAGEKGVSIAWLIKMVELKNGRVRAADKLREQCRIIDKKYDAATDRWLGNAGEWEVLLAAREYDAAIMRTVAAAKEYLAAVIGDSL